MNSFNVRWRTSAVAIALVLLVIIVYYRVGGHSFIVMDDEDYVSKNDIVKAGLSEEGIRWAFSTFHAGNWHPLTWISHMADVELFGVDAGRHHLMNVLFHSANTLLVLFVFLRMTGSLWRSTFIAALFAVHPLHVEPVAWIAERKDVLSTFFMLLALRAYAAYSSRPNIVLYGTVLLLYSCGLLAKPMIVTFPFVLLLLDYWPLGRFASSARECPRGSGRRRARCGGGRSRSGAG